ncbi:MAG: DUF6443 domain-containing protein, partial [Chryseolinea sp.]
TDIVIGQYVFSFTVIDYNLERSLPDYVTINVTVPPNNYNWIKETTVLVKGKLQETDLTSLQVTTGEKNVSLNYYDGLGRPMQSIEVQASPAFKDKLIPVVYDGYGRENAKYLPFTMSNNNSYYQKKSDIIDPATGNYKGNAANFYSDSNPFSETSFEFSSLDRPLKEFGAGNDWRADNKFTEYRHLTNTHYITGSGLSLTAEKIVAWKITSGLPTRALPATGFVESGGYYSTGQLIIRSTKDENNYETRDYTDKLGRIILKKVQVSSTVNSLDDNVQWALTYYVYDDFGNLRFVFQPVLSATVLGSDTYAPLQADLDRLAFQYNYDEKQRQVEKKVPGADWIYFIYDKLDRLVMTQDGNQRKDINNNQKNDWTITKYDMLNRPVMTAIYTHTAFVSRTTMAGLISTTNFFESYNGAASTHGYTSLVFPTSGFQVLTVHYYDSYKFRDDFGLAATTSFGYTTGDITGQEASYNTSVIGLVTGSKINKIGTTNYLFNVNYFDQKYRTIQTKNQNQFGGIDRSTNLFDFVRIKETKSFHIKGTTTHTINRRFDYDHVGRLLRTWFKLNTQPEILLVSNTYNELGQLIDKKLHSTVASASDAVQSVDYRYNIRGWLTSINNASLTNDVTTNDDGTDYFGMNLAYNTVDSDLANGKQYNGNIAAIKWSNYPGTGPAKQKGYTYTYDPMNRILSSVFKEKNATWASAVNNGFSETGYSYDLNGNIIKMKRNDKRDTGWMDDMTYNYGVPGSTQSNRLLRVEDSGDDYMGFVDGNPGTDDDYTYDNNGNMTRDRNKGLGVALIENGDFIVYNFLNLPETITKGGNTVKYIYDATGRKLTQIVTSGGTQKQTDYFGDFTYENDELQFINNEEGRIMMTSSKLISFNNGEELNTIGALNNANLSLVTQQNNKEKYVQATTVATTLRTGIFPIGSDVPVAASERYRIRVKGYSTGPNVVNLLVTINGNDLNFPGVAFPSSAVTESWLEQIITIPASYGASATMRTGVVWSAASTTDVLYFNELEITKLENQAASPEFQYILKDHLGNARVTFTTKPETESPKATMELVSRPSESSKFLRYDKVRIVNSQPMFDNTNGTANGSSIRLSGGPDDKTGLLRTISVMPGDVVNMEVYAKYLDQTTSNWTTALTSLVSAIASGSTSYVTDGTYYDDNDLNPFPLTGKNGTTSSPGTGPRAFLCYHSFDRNFVPITPEADPSQTFYVRMDESAKEDGKSGPNGVPHQRLFASVTVKQAGYMSIYLSNQEPSPVEVYFDDFKVEQIKSPIIQTNDYYPFGLTFNSNARESSVKQDYQYNGKELQDELELNWLDYGARMYLPELGRWVTMDPLSESYYFVSPYSYVDNNPVQNSDPDGRFIVYGAYRKETRAAIKYLKRNSPSARREIRRLQWSLKKTKISGQLTGSGSSAYNPREIYYTPYSGLQNINGDVMSPAILLAHEIRHAAESLRDPNLLDENSERNQAIDPQTGEPVVEEETTDFESKVAGEINDNLNDGSPEGQRENYSDITEKPHVNSPTSNTPEKYSSRTKARIARVQARVFRREARKFSKQLKKNLKD